MQVAELLGKLPVDGRGPAVQQAGLGQSERTRAEPDKSGATAVGAPQGGQDIRVAWCVEVGAVGNHDGVDRVES